MFVRGEGIVLSEPSVVAVDTRDGEVHAVGEEAQRMIGRTPASIAAVRPLRHGVIADFEVTEQMLRHFIGRVHRSRFAHPRLIMCAPSGITDVERRALTEASMSAGARSVHLIEEPLAAAIGAGLPIDEPRASVVVDIGGGTSEVAVISLGGIVVSRSLRVGGYDFDEVVAAWIRTHHGLVDRRGLLRAGQARDRRRRAGRHRRPLGGARPRPDVRPAARGRGARPRRSAPALEPPISDIVAEVKSALEETPPELASDIPQRGILLAGGGALLRGFAARLEAETNVPVRIAESPLDCVALGAGAALDEIELLERTAERTGGTLTALRRPGGPAAGAAALSSAARSGLIDHGGNRHREESSPIRWLRKFASTTYRLHDPLAHEPRPPPSDAPCARAGRGRRRPR